ncbi:MAG: hypothetical protein JNJ73_19260 [Hyphomonadaceae bacterium]|nr:hypothetical protein [Hyphomonadaceae bacterium]
MPHFIVEYRQSGTPEAREAHRAEHMAYRKGFGDRMPLAGPLLDDEGKPVGSLVIIEAADKAAAETAATDDPYVKVGVLQLVAVRPYRIAAIKAPIT